jgi:hypothetical protein
VAEAAAAGWPRWGRTLALGGSATFDPRLEFSAMTVFSYVVAKDGGFAPKPFHAFCTLACCKPKIRETASV